MKPINRYIDHTLLKPTASGADIARLCAEAVEHRFAAVCVHGMYVEQAVENLNGSSIPVAAVVGFPLGAQASMAKQQEAALALQDGAKEIDMVLSIGALKEGNTRYVLEELQLLRKLDNNYVLKVILETAYLTDAKKVLACRLAVESGADFVKTSTGFGPGGASLEDVALMLKAVEGKAQVKASGGIRDLVTMKDYIQMGATRIGTSSGVTIMDQWLSERKKGAQ